MSITTTDLYLITGGAGFIGSALVRGLLKAGVRVRVVDNFSTGFRSNLDEVIGGIELVEGDLAEPEVCRRAVQGAHYVLHQAALPSVPRSFQDPVATNRANVTATLNLLVACRDAQIRRVVFASSCAVYGEAQALPISETMPEKPASPYALSKWIGEKYAEMLHSVFGLSTVSLRYFNVFGPRQDPSSPYSGVISRFLSAALSGRGPVVYGDGEQTRDFIYVEDVVEANLLACHAESVAGMVFNIGTGEHRSLNQLLRGLSAVLGADLKPEHQPPRPGDIRDSQADVGRARRLLGFEPRVGFEEGLRRTVAWFRENPGKL
jgi:UDP-glucose 4-epimerase